MVFKIAIWRVEPSGTVVGLTLPQPDPVSLDDATRRLPGGGYTTFRTFNHYRVLRMASHYDRLEETARLAGKVICLNRKKMDHALHQALAAYPGNDMRVRIILDLEDRPGNIYLMVETLHTPGKQDYEVGVKVVTRRLQRENPKAKLTKFIETAAEVRQELPAGVNEAVMVGADGRLLEGLSSNFFAVKDGRIWTADEGVLSGITRSLLLDSIHEEGIPLRLKGMPYEDVGTLDEAFITSASRAVLPVTEIDGHLVGDGRPGPVTLRLTRVYQSRLEKELDTPG